MSYKFKLNLLKSIFSAILSAIFAGTYCYLVYNKIIDNPLYWATFVLIPIVLVTGPKWKLLPVHFLNVLIGFFLGGSVAYLVISLVNDNIYFPIAFGLGSLVGVFLVQFITTAALPSFKSLFWLGECGIAFVSMTSCFACNNDNIIIFLLSLLSSVVLATCIGYSEKLAERILKNKK